MGSMPENGYDAERRGRAAEAPVLNRFVARHSPLSLVLREAIERLGPDRYRLVEDYRFPPMLWRLAGGLFRKLRPRADARTFLSEDRPEIRTAMILEKVEGPGQETLSHLELARRLRKLLRESGRKERDCAVTLLGDSPLGASDGSTWRPTALVVWSGDVTPLESLLGLRPAELPSTLLRTFGSGQGNAFPMPTAPRPKEQSSDTQKPHVEAEVRSPGQEAPDLPLAIAQAIVRSEPTRLPPGLSHEVIGSTRGARYRKLLVREMPYGKRFVLFSSEKRPNIEVEQAFFDRVGYAADSVVALRQLQSTWPPGIRAFAMELNSDGSFRAATCGVRPLFWKESQQKMVPFPESRSGMAEHPLRVIRGLLGEDDAVLILPRTATRSETEALEQVWTSGPRALVLGPITSRLDAMGFGKTLLVSKIG